MNPKRAARYYYLKFRRLRGNPRSLALGSAIGAFMAVMPIMPLRTIVIIACTAFIRASTLAAFIVATIISNPFTYVPLYYCAFVMGNVVTPYRIDWQRVQSVLDIVGGSGEFSESIQAVFSLGLETVMVLLAGGFVLAIPIGLITYSFSLQFFTKRRNSRN